MEEKEVERELREEVNKQRDICLRLLRKGNLDIDGTDGARDKEFDIDGTDGAEDKEKRTEQLNPAEEQAMEDEEQREERKDPHQKVKR